MMTTMVFLSALAIVSLVLGVFALAVPQPEGSRWWPLAIVTVGLALGGVASAGSWWGVALLSLAEIAAGLTLLSQADTEARRAGRLYLLAILSSIVLAIAAFALTGLPVAEPGGMTTKLAVILLLLAFALKLGLLPLTFWVPAVARSASIGTVILIIAIVDIATFHELAHLGAEAPWVFALAKPVWIALALVAMVGGAFLAYAQSDLRSMLAYSTITDLGLLLLGVSLGGEAALTGAMIGALSHALSKAVLFGSTGIAERRLGTPVTLETRGLAASMPLVSAAFILAAINFIGVPPGMGFGAYWRIYLAAVEAGGIWLITVLLVVAAIDLLVYARAIHRIWLGAPHQETVSAVPQFGPAALIVLVVLAVAAGLYPAPLTGAFGAGEHDTTVTSESARAGETMPTYEAEAL